jgi:hypothetical protein
MLERNRLATIVRTYPSALLALVMPALIATELAVLAASVAGGWTGSKLLAWRDFAGALPRLLGERRAIQSARAISAYEFAGALTPELSSPYLGSVAATGPVRFVLRAYWAAVLAVLRVSG